MQYIAICDDETNICANLESSLINILKRLNIRHDIDTFETGAELYEKIKNGKHYDLLFLDIELAQDMINGIEISSLIRDELRNNLMSICFISWQMKYAMSLFDSHPINFLIKPLNDPEIEKVIKKFTALSNSQNATLNYKIRHDSYRKPLKEILYLESHGRKITIYLINGTTEEFYGQLKEIYPLQLQQHDFLFIHASYIVNYDHVMKFSYDELVLVNGKRLSISQTNRVKIRADQHTIEKRRAEVYKF